MYYYQIFAFLTYITSSFICLLVIFTNSKTKTNKTFVCYSLFVALWSGSFFLWMTSNKEPDTLYLIRICNLFAVFIPSTFIHFICHLINVYEKHKKFIIYLYTFGILIIPFALFTNYFIKNDPPILFFSHWPHGGFLHYFLFLEYTLIIGYALYILFKKLKATSGNQHQQLKFIFWGVLAAYLGGITYFPLCYNIPIPPIGNFLVPIYCIFITYAIFKYQLMDISIVVKKSLIYTVLISIITLFYLILIYFTEHIIQTYFGYKSLFISIVSATVIALAFIPLRNFIQSFIEKSFFQGTYTKISEENELLREEVAQTERLKTVAILASGMAHEIKNPLTVLKTFTEYLPSKLDDKEFLKKFTPMVLQEVDRINNLVHELLDFAKPAAPILKLVNIHELIKNTSELLNNEYIKHHIKMNLDLQNQEIQLLYLDYNQIKQSLLNVLLNAIDAMPHGGMLNISTYASFNNERFNIKIQDTGIGINQNDIPHIFDPFFTKKDSGTGLGLAITYEIIRKHGGKIYVESVKNKGTSFIIELPTTPPSQTIQAEP